MIVAGKALGQKRPLFADFSVPLPPREREDGQYTLRDLIDAAVRAEVAGFHARQAERSLVRALTEKQVAEGALAGKIAAGSQSEPQTADPDEAVGAALQAFEDGLYLVVIDGTEQKELDRELHVTDESRVTFVRLTLLAGG